ncbi:MAG: hypothetical protein DHS20C08_22170 [Rhodomicrobium sp.]|nr:MAG: hypothetical protein DHS20C08_22170 [Rhodomicrobium sp.]
MRLKSVLLPLTLICFSFGAVEASAACKGPMKTYGEHKSQHGARVLARQSWYANAGAGYSPKNIKFTCRKRAVVWRCVMSALACRSGAYKSK